MALVPLCSSLDLEGVALFLSRVVEKGHFFLKQLDGRVDFVGVVGRKEFEFLELVDDLNSVREIFVFGFFLFLLLLVLLLWCLLI